MSLDSLDSFDRTRVFVQLVDDTCLTNSRHAHLGTQWRGERRLVTCTSDPILIVSLKPPRAHSAATAWRAALCSLASFLPLRLPLSRMLSAYLPSCGMYMSARDRTCVQEVNHVLQGSRHRPGEVTTGVATGTLAASAVRDGKAGATRPRNVRQSSTVLIKPLKWSKTWSEGKLSQHTAYVPTPSYLRTLRYKELTWRITMGRGELITHQETGLLFVVTNYGQSAQGV